MFTHISPRFVCLVLAFTPAPPAYGMIIFQVALIRNVHLGARCIVSRCLCLLQCFVDLYSGPILEDLYESLKMRYPTIQFPPIPPRGTLKLEDVKKSKYFFNWFIGVFCTHNLACHSHMTIDLASLQSRDGARRVSAGPGGGWWLNGIYYCYMKNRCF